MEDFFLKYEPENEPERKAFLILNCWLNLRNKIFPNYNHPKISKNPKTSVLFKVCYKLQSETKGYLKEEEYKLYVLAQLSVLKHIQSSGGDPHIDINCLVGEKAWKRWKLWKKKYDEITLCNTISGNEIKIIGLLLKTKDFLNKNNFNYKNYDSFLNEKEKLLSWIKLGYITPYFLILSELFQKLLNENEEIKKSLNDKIEIYKETCTDVIRNKFKNIFN